MIVLVIAIIAVGILLGGHHPSQGMLYYGLLIGETLLCLVLVIVTIVFAQTNLVYKEIILVRVFEYVEIRNNTSSSEDSPHQHIASDTFEIIIDEEY